jgi:hypothetical protein
MKKLLLVLIFAVSPCFAEAPKITIAIVDQNKLNQKVGYAEMRNLENPSEFRETLGLLNRQIEELGKRLIDAKDDEELDRINLELGFLRKKSQSILSVASMNANRGDDRNVLNELIVTHFKDKYPVIIYDQGNGGYMSSALYENIVEVDITDEVVALVKSKLKGPSVRENE